MSKRSRIIAIIAILFMLIITTSCEKFSGVIKKGSIDKHKDNIVGQYEEFDGNISYSIKLKGKYVVFKGDSTDDLGDIIIRVMDKDENTLLEWKNPKGEEEKINLNCEGKYKIEIIGEKHKGDFTVSWY